MRHTSNPFRGSPAGFSVIELLTALVVVGILSSLAAPALGGFIDANRTRRAVDQIVAEVAFARLVAVENGQRTAVVVSADGSYEVERLAPDGSWTTLRAVDLNQEFTGVTVVSGETRLEFSSRGVLANQTTESTIELARNEARASAFVSAAGRVYREH